MKVIERVQAHYKIQDVEMGKVYRWCPESVVVECEQCGENTTLTSSKRACEECGKDHRAIVGELGLEASSPEEEKAERPWRSLHPYYEPIRGT